MMFYVIFCIIDALLHEIINSKIIFFGILFEENVIKEWWKITYLEILIVMKVCVADKAKYQEILFELVVWFLIC